MVIPKVKVTGQSFNKLLSIHYDICKTSRKKKLSFPTQVQRQLKKRFWRYTTWHKKLWKSKIKGNSWLRKGKNIKSLLISFSRTTREIYIQSFVFGALFIFYKDIYQKPFKGIFWWYYWWLFTLYIYFFIICNFDLQCWFESRV